MLLSVLGYLGSLEKDH